MLKSCLCVVISFCILKLSLLYVEIVLYHQMVIFTHFIFLCVYFIFRNERLCFRIAWFEILRVKRL